MAKEKKKKRGAGTRKSKPTRPSLPKDKGGRPKEKVSDKVDFSQLAFLCQKGATDRELAHFWHVAESTINRWKKDEKFKKILVDSKAVANEMVKQALFDRAIGMVMGEGKYAKYYPPDVEGIKFWLMNREGEEWRIKQEMDITKPIKIEFPYRQKPKTKR